MQSSFGKEPDYTGFDQTLWEPRCNESQHQHALKHKECTTASKQKAIEREYAQVVDTQLCWSYPTMMW